MVEVVKQKIWPDLEYYTSRGPFLAVAAIGLGGLYVALAPSTTPITSLDLYNDKRLLQIGLLITVGVILIASRSARRQWLSAFQGLPLLAKAGLASVLGLGLVSALLAPAPWYALLEIGHFFLLFALAGTVAAVYRNSPARTEAFLLGAIVLSVLLYAVHFGVSYGMSVILPALEVGRETISGFANTRHFNQYQTWTLPLLVGAVLALPKRWRVGRGIVFLLSSLWWTLVFASNVRGTVVAIGIAAAGVWLLFRDHSYRWLSVQAAALLMGGGLYYILFYLGGGVVPQIAEKLGEVGQGRRLQHWWTCLEMAGAHPWLGTGPMHFAWPPYHFAPAAHPHNALMQWLAEWGIPSTGIMAGLTVWGVWRWMQQEKETAENTGNKSNYVGIALVAAILAGATHAMVSGIIVMPVSQILLALIGGWAWGRYRHEDSLSTPSFSVRAHAVLCIVLLTSMVVVGSSLQDLSTVEERRSAYLEAVDRSGFSPRYWGQGYLHVRDPDVIERAQHER